MIELSEEQRAIQELARDFARTEIRPVAAEVDERDVHCPIDVVYKAAELGLTSFMLPEEVGGGGIEDVLTGCLVQEELNWGCAGIGNLITSAGFFARTLVEVGTAEQKQRWLAPLTTATPPLTALGSTEPGVGSDTAAMTTTAERTDCRVSPQRSEDLDLQRRASPSTTASSPRWRRAPAPRA